MGDRKSIVLSVPKKLWQELNGVGFINGSTPSTLTNEWVVHKIEDSLKSYRGVDKQ